MTANHDEAFQLAYMKREESNLARAYLELREVEANVRAELARSARAMPEWAHLKQYGYAPGDYMNRCHACGEVVEFVDKRAIICRPCAEAKHALATALPAVTPHVADEGQIDMPEDDEAHEAWVSACEVDGIKHCGSAFERGWELALSNGAPEWPMWATQILKVVREYSGYDGFDDQDGVDLVEETSECLRELAAMADRARAAATPPIVTGPMGGLTECDMGDSDE